MKKTAQARPTETAAAVAGALAAIIGPLVGLDNAEDVSALAVLLGALPAVVTFIVETARGN